MTEACWKCREHDQAVQSARAQHAPAVIRAILEENASKHAAEHAAEHGKGKR